MEEITNVIPTETTEVVVEETAKTFDGESFAMGAAGGAAAAVGVYLLVQKLIVPGVRKLKVRIAKKKAAAEKSATETTEEFKEDQTE